MKPKYAVINLAALAAAGVQFTEPHQPDVAQLAEAIRQHPEAVLLPGPGPEEFFVLKLKDIYVPAALAAYGAGAAADGHEIGDEVLKLAVRSSQMPNRKRPS